MPKTDDEFRQLQQILEVPTGKEWESTIRLLLRLMGENPNREGLTRTPMRMKRSLQFLTSGYRQNPAKILSRSFAQVKHDEMVIVKDIDFFSMCEHHVLPFYGHAYVGYIAHEGIIGISKLTRLVRIFAKRFTVQERIGEEIANGLVEMLQPHGVAVYLEAYHLCTQMRGVREISPTTRTTFWRGAYDADPALRAEFYTTSGLP